MDDEEILAEAAKSEPRRRLMLTAIAIKRFQLQRGRKPKALADLSPNLLTSPPVDFMDGRELRYQLFEDGRFMLYSVGLDCFDDGGSMKEPQGLKERWRSASFVLFLPQTTARTIQSTVHPAPSSPRDDLVWPMPANDGEVLESKKTKAPKPTNETWQQPVEIHSLLRSEFK